MRVLVVEDEPYLADAVRSGLRLEAVATDVAGDGDTAPELPAQNRSLPSGAGVWPVAVCPGR